MRKLAGAAIATIQDYPSIAAGSCAFAVAFALVAGNALLGQPGGHPDPIWATRDKVTTQSVASLGTAIPVRKVRTETVVPAHIPIPSLRPVDPGEQDAASDLVRDTQHALAMLGVYDGAIDGLYGPRTREAIEQFQRANGVGADGQVSRPLLEAALALSRTRTDEKQASAAAKDVARMQPASVRSSDGVRAELASTGDAQDVARAAMIARIQIGLMNFGEAGIAIDGVLGPQTAAAIRAFQERYGLAVTGEPDASVIRKLEQIGALQKNS